MGESVIGKTSPHPEWRIIVERLSVMDYDTLVTHAAIAEMTGLHYPSPRYFQQVRRARGRLVDDYAREIAAVFGQGYRIVTPEVMVGGRARREGIRGLRHWRMEARLRRGAPQQLLSDEHNRRNADALAKLGGLLAHAGEYRRETRPSALPPPQKDVPKMLTE